VWQSFFESLDMETLSTKLAEYLPNVLGALIVIIGFRILSYLIRRVARASFAHSHIPSDAQQLILRFIKYGIVIIAVLTVAAQLGINITSLVAGLGIAGLAVSFAAQDNIANLIAGISILIDRPFKQNDWISVNDLHASVTDIRLRTTVLTTFDNETVVVPNRDLVQQRVINYTLNPGIRVRVPVGIAYKENIEDARKVMLSTLEGDDRILSEPAPSVLVASLGDSSVNLEMRFWTDNSNLKFPLMWEYTEKCKSALDNANIQIPFPHMQLFLEKTEGLQELVPKPKSE